MASAVSESHTRRSACPASSASATGRRIASDRSSDSGPSRLRTCRRLGASRRSNTIHEPSGACPPRSWARGRRIRTARGMPAARRKGRWESGRPRGTEHSARRACPRRRRHRRRRASRHRAASGAAGRWRIHRRRPLAAGPARRSGARHRPGAVRRCGDWAIQRRSRSAVRARATTNLLAAPALGRRYKKHQKCAVRRRVRSHTPTAGARGGISCVKDRTSSDSS